jgi:putative SOS response-associated peptidase YedK
VCGRATLSSPAEDIAEIFGAPPIDVGPPRYNIAPTQPILTVRSAGEGRELALLRWGLIPWWAKPDEAKKIASRCIQARAETVRRSPAFRDAFRRHRCLVVVDGFYEWRTVDGKKLPHLIRQSSRQPLAIAGVWDRWRAAATDDRSDATESCAVLTTRSAGPLRELHDRMPLVLPPEAWTPWLSGSDAEAASLLAQGPEVLEPRAGDLVVIPVSTWVNNVRNEDPRCIEPMTAGG